MTWSLLLMKCELIVCFCPTLNAHGCIIRERGVRKAPDLLPEDYTGGDEDEGSIGL